MKIYAYDDTYIHTKMHTYTFSFADISLVVLKVIASAAVRLFRVNPTTNEFEGVENGSALGGQ